MENIQLKRCFDEVDKDDVEGETEEWSQQWQPSPSVKPFGNSQSASSACAEHERTIIHIDLDCFYAQVEMIQDPSLRDKPLGIQQKNIVVTCNYVARERGVGKLSYVKDAVKKCPELVLVSGEDLTKYRQMSYKVTDYFLQFCPLVERLGFDENFIDVTKLVKERQVSGETHDVKGHTYSADFNEEVPRMHCTCGCYQRLAIGSQIASEMRAGLKQSLGLTGCAGIAHNKLLSKLVAGTHKPNQQTVIFPQQADAFMLSLKTVRQIPGIGSSMSKRLAEMGIVSVQQLRAGNLNCMKQEFGDHVANTILSLSQGCDPTPVIRTGPPQSLSDEDSFKKCTSMDDARKRTRELIRNLLQRLKEDGRVPHTLRVAIRKMSTQKHWTRESRQSPLPDSILHDFDLDAVLEKLLDVAMHLLIKLVDTSQPFHLTLISVCFTKLEDRSKKPSITAYFKKTSDGPAIHHGAIDTKVDHRPKKSISTYFKRSEDELSHKAEACGSEILHKPSPFDSAKNTGSNSTFEKKDNQKVGNLFFQGESSVKKQRTNSCTSGLSANNQNTLESRRLISELFSEKRIPEHEVKPDLTEKLQKKMMMRDNKNSVEKTNFQLFKSVKLNSDPLPFLKHPMNAGSQKKQQHVLSAKPEHRLSNPDCMPSSVSDQDLPPDVDASVFIELPLSVQRELIENWKREKKTLHKGKSKSNEVKKSIKDFFTTK